MVFLAGIPKIRTIAPGRRKWFYIRGHVGVSGKLAPGFNPLLSESGFFRDACFCLSIGYNGSSPLMSSEDLVSPVVAAVFSGSAGAVSVFNRTIAGRTSCPRNV